jgi:hypothetical protein
MSLVENRKTASVACYPHESPSAFVLAADINNFTDPVIQLKFSFFEKLCPDLIAFVGYRELLDRILCWD